MIMELTTFLDNTIKRATVPGQGVFARDLYNIYATYRLNSPSAELTPSFLTFVKDLKSLGYRVDRNKAKYRHGQTKIFDVVMAQ